MLKPIITGLQDFQITNLDIVSCNTYAVEAIPYNTPHPPPPSPSMLHFLIIEVLLRKSINYKIVYTHTFLVNVWSWLELTHWAISCSSQCSTTGVTKAVVCVILSGMVHIKEPLLLIDNSSLCGGIRFPFSLSEWSLTICLTPYNRR